MATSKDMKTRERLIATPRKRKSTIPPDEDVRYVTRLVLKNRKLLAEDAEADSSQADGKPVKTKLKRKMVGSPTKILCKSSRKRKQPQLPSIEENLTGSADEPLHGLVKRRKFGETDGQKLTSFNKPIRILKQDEDVRYVTRLVLKKRKLLAEDAEADKPIRILKQEDIKKGRALGVGEFGKVFLCKVRAEDGIWRDAVLKILTLWPSMEDFVRETECLQKLQGIKGVPVLYGRQFSPDLAFVMSYCGGKTLEKFLEDNSCNIPKICQVLSRTAAILSAIHRRGISHNDLHSENVMVDETSIPGQSLPKIIDFGYAMAFGSVLFPEALEDWADFHYDPFVSRDCGTTSAQTDIYSFAKLISRILDGKKWKQQMNLERLVERALSTNKNIRPSLEEFRRVLLHVKRLEETKRRRKKKE